MSQAQIVSEKVAPVTFEIVPNPDVAKPQQKKRRSNRRKSDAAAIPKKENSPSEPKKSETMLLNANQLLIGRKTVGLVNKIKVLFADHETVDLIGTYG